MLCQQIALLCLPHACGDHRHVAQVMLPAAVTARQRAVLHSLAEEHGLTHNSRGDGGQRRITLAAAGAKGHSDAPLVTACQCSSVVVIYHEFWSAY